MADGGRSTSLSMHFHDALPSSYAVLVGLVGGVSALDHTHRPMGVPVFFMTGREEGWSPTSILDEAEVSAMTALQVASGLDHTQVRQLALGVGGVTIKVNIQNLKKKTEI